MDQGPLVTEETEAGADLVRRFDKYINVKVAFWVRASDENRWYLYIASDQIDDKSLGPAYGEILRLAEQIESPYLDPFQVNLVTTSDPLARAAIDINHRYPGNVATRLGGNNFGGMSVQGVYIYPPSITAATS